MRTGVLSLIRASAFGRCGWGSVPEDWWLIVSPLALRQSHLGPATKAARYPAEAFVTGNDSGDGQGESRKGQVALVLVA